MSYRILALYKFVSPKYDRASLPLRQDELERFCISQNVRGTLILSSEGINGTISYPYSWNEDELRKDVSSIHKSTKTMTTETTLEVSNCTTTTTTTTSLEDPVYEYFTTEYPNLTIRISHDEKPAFPRLSIKIKSQIVTLSKDMATNDVVDPTISVGDYVNPGHEWDQLLEDPTCLVIDTRNEYEIQLGTFMGAINPGTTQFTEFPNWLQSQTKNNLVTSDETDPPNPINKIAMFCTGGIRCEKATSLARHILPNTKIYHLKGGILSYLETVPPDQSRFQGECYVFDQRVAVTHGLQATKQYVSCFACRHPLSLEDRSQESYVEGISCTYCIDSHTEKQKQRYLDRSKQIELAEQKGILHVYDPKFSNTRKKQSSKTKQSY
jgi:UPF0176 protein